MRSNFILWFGANKLAPYNQLADYDKIHENTNNRQFSTSRYNRMAFADNHNFWMQHFLSHIFVSDFMSLDSRSLVLTIQNMLIDEA